MPPIRQVRAGAAGVRTADAAPAVGPLARAAEVELQLREEQARRRRAETRADAAEALAEARGARIALLEARAVRDAEASAGRSADGDALLRALRDGLTALRGELDALRAQAEAVAARPEPVDPVPAVAERPTTPPRTTTTTDPSIRMGELARGARELLAGGRLDAADEVIRGLEDAAERLRAQTPPLPDEA